MPELRLREGDYQIIEFLKEGYSLRISLLVKNGTLIIDKAGLQTKDLIIEG